MELAYENPEIEHALEAARTLDALEPALVALANLVPSFMSPEIFGRQLFCPKLDAIAARMAARLQLADVAMRKSNDNCCIVATRFYATGGHSRIAADISKRLGAERTSIVFTDIYRERRHGEMLSRNDSYAYRSLSLLSAPTLGEKIIELYMLLAAIRPSRIFLMGNHMDMVATVASWPFRSVVDYIHHADHLPALGATLPYSAHVDLTYNCHLACRAAGVDAVYSGMTTASPAAAPRRAAPPRETPIRFATCGSLHKYRQPARHRWVDFVLPILRRSGTEFVHIGPWDDDFAAEIGSALAAAGIEPQRYRFAGPTADLRDTLVAEDVDIYVGSYPHSGARANLDAMAAGLAPIVPEAEELPPLLHFAPGLESWVRVTEPSEIPGAIARSVELTSQLRSDEGQERMIKALGSFDAFVANPPGADQPGNS